MKQLTRSVLALCPFAFVAVACSAPVTDNSFPYQDPNASYVPPGDTTSPSGETPTSTVTDPNQQTCATLCEVEVIVPATTSVDGCTAAVWQNGTDYPGGSVVSKNGYEYTSVYWTFADPEVNSGPSGSGQPWSEGVACTGSAEPTVTTKLECCDVSSAGTGGSSGVDTSTGGSGSTDSSGTGGSSSTGGSTSSGSIANLLDENLFNQMFPNRNSFFTFAAFAEAAKAYPGFAGQGSDEVRKRELAAFLANIAHETTGGWASAPGGPQAWGLYYKEELNCSGGCPQYCQSSPQYPCAAGKSYHGRGPIQLSYNYNYGPAGDALGVNLLANPELVTSDAVIAFKTGLWFWMNGKSGGASTSHEAMVQSQGFGATIRIINGIECNGGNYAAVTDRVEFFKRFTGILGISTGSNLTC